MISGSPDCAARGTAPPAAGSGVPGQMVTPRGAACGPTAGAVADRGPVTEVISRRAKPGTQNDAADRATGTSPEPIRRHDKARDIADAPVAAQRRTALEAWFCVPGHAAQTIKPPPRWKHWLVSLVAAYPLVLLFQAFIAPQIRHWPLEAKSALLPLCVLTLLTYVVMPPVSRLLRGWLNPSSRARRRGRSRQHSSGTVAASVRPGRDGRGRTPARCWPGRPPIAGCLAASPHPSPGKGLTRPVPPAAVFDLALESTGDSQWPAEQARRPGVPGVKVANPYPKGI